MNRILQDKFKISLCLIITDHEYDAKINNDQICRLLGMNTRILYCKQNTNLIIDVIRSYYNTLQDTERKHQQLQYFQKLRETNAAKEICFNLFKNLEVVEEDWNVLVDATPSISLMICSKKDDMLEQNPCEINTILKICGFTENYRK